MSIVFAGAPVVNALFTLWQHPPPGGVSSIKLPFFLGIVLAALGGFLVTYYKPPAAAPPKPARESVQISPAKSTGS